jgi:hypothetical protein
MAKSSYQGNDEEGLPSMSDIAKNMAERIRKAAAAGPASFATGHIAVEVNGGPSRWEAASQTAEGRAAYSEAAKTAFESTYGVSLDSVTDLFVPKNDIVYASAEQGVSLDDFTKTLGSQMAFDVITGKEPEFAKYLAGENEVKLALAEFAYSTAEWTFTDGYAATDNDGGVVVVAPAYDETINAWQFSAYSAPCDKDGFVAMSRAQKAATPSEDRVYGDIDDCIKAMFTVKAAPAAMRM